MYNPKEAERTLKKHDDDVELQIVLSLSEITGKKVDNKESGSSQEPLITPKNSNESRDEILSEIFQKSEFLGE